MKVANSPVLLVVILLSLILVAAQLLYINGVSVVKKSGQSISLNCTADGIPTPTIVWMNNGQLIVLNNKRSISVQLSAGFRSNNNFDTVRTTSILTINDLTGSDNGSYSCRADNKANIGAVLNAPYQLAVIECKKTAPLSLISKFDIDFLSLVPPTDFCLSSPCVNGNCQSLSDAYYCVCPETHTGRNCQESKFINDCLIKKGLL